MDQDESHKVLHILQKDVSHNIQGFQNTFQKFGKDLQKQDSLIKGLSFLELKNHLMMQYLINLNSLILKMIHQKEIKGSGCIKKLVEIRTVLERIRPIDKQLKYEIDKAVKIANQGHTDSGDPLAFKPNPKNLSHANGNDLLNHGSSTNMESASELKYRPPMIAPQYYDESEDAKNLKAIEKSKKKALSSSVIRGLIQEYGDEPEEIIESRNLQKIGIEKRIVERTKYEEEHMTRLPLTKKDRNEERELVTLSSLNYIPRLGAGTFLDADGQPSEGSRGLKRKKKLKHKGKKSVKKKFRHR